MCWQQDGARKLGKGGAECQTEMAGCVLNAWMAPSCSDGWVEKKNKKINTYIIWCDCRRRTAPIHPEECTCSLCLRSSLPEVQLCTAALPLASLTSLPEHGSREWGGGVRTGYPVPKVVLPPMQLASCLQFLSDAHYCSGTVMEFCVPRSTLCGIT